MLGYSTYMLHTWQRFGRIVLRSLPYIGLVFSYCLVLAAIEPKATAPIYSFPNGEVHELGSEHFPHQFTGSVVIEQRFTLRSVHPVNLQIIPSRCVHALQINGWHMTLPLGCGLATSTTVPLWHALHAGTNTVRALASNPTGLPTAITAMTPNDPLLSLVHVFFGGGLLWLFWRSFRTSWLLQHRDLWLVGICGVVVRLFYALQTPLGTRAYDVSGHIEYVLYVLEFLKLPAPTFGWQTYQPPLYYVLSALTLAPLRLAGGSASLYLFVLPILCFSLSVLILYVGLCIARDFFPQPAARWYRLLLAATVAVLPGIVFFAARFSNDSLMVLWFFLFVWQLQKFWLTKQKIHLCWTVLVLIAALFTKANAIALIPALFGTIWLQPKVSSARKFRQLIWSCGALALATGWYFIWQYGFRHQVHIIGNIGSNPSGLFVQHWRPMFLFALRPVFLLTHPFYLPWDDASGRPFFFHVLLTSAYSGEWKFSPSVLWLLRLVHLTNIVLLPLGFYAFLERIIQRERIHIPLALCTVSLIAATMLLQIQKHNSGLQDFRYVTLLVIPVSYYVLSGIAMLKKPYRNIALGIYALQMVALVVFYPLLLFTN
jgi:hypothetical protein